VEPQKNLAGFIRRVGDLVVAVENVSPATHARADWLLQEAEALKQKFKINAGHCLPGSGASTARVQMEQQAYAAAVGAKYAQVCAERTAATNGEKATSQSVNESAAATGAAVSVGTAVSPSPSVASSKSAPPSSYRATGTGKSGIATATGYVAPPTSAMALPAVTKASQVMSTAYTWGAGAAAMLNKARAIGNTATAGSASVYTTGNVSAGYIASGGYQASGGSTSHTASNTEYLKSFLPGSSRNPASVSVTRGGPVSRSTTAVILPAHHDLFQKVSDRYLAVCLRGVLYDCALPKR
jgi:hypothetical protein